MTTTINADNGVSSGSAGLKESADSSGVLQLQTNGTAALTIDTSQNVGIGTASPSYKLHSSSTGYTISGVFQTDQTGSYITLKDATTASVTSCRIGVIGENIVFLNNGAGEKMRIDSSGNVLVTSAAGLGYGTGAGGTVTQATSKSTAVTLNKPTGAITMNNAALAAGASAVFIVNNTLVASADVIVANPYDNANYVVQCVNTASGAFRLRVTNITAGSLSEAVGITFAIIKGATS